MKRLLVIGIAALLLVRAVAADAASVSGKVSFVSKRGQNPTVNETLVWLEPAGKSSAKKSPATFQMVTRGKALVPHVMAIPVGSTIEFPNDDPISHNLFSLSSPNAFDLGLYRRGAGKNHKFETAGLVNVYCNVHPQMSSVIHVMGTPYYGFTDANGVYTIADVPAGKYRLVAWNEQGGQNEAPIEVTSSGQVVGTVALTLDSRNFRNSQHLNKEGKAYQPTTARDY
jgi:plastocyanin